MLGWRITTPISRVGITGKTQLNALERQLGRINKDLNKINKGLKAQTLTINTKGATRALDQLDRKRFAS